jgi:hypothetical protein
MEGWEAWSTIELRAEDRGVSMRARVAVEMLDSDARLTEPARVGGPIPFVVGQPGLGYRRCQRTKETALAPGRRFRFRSFEA